MTPTTATGRRGAGASRSLVVGLVLVAVAFLLGAAPLSDNSFLTHLATGRLILTGHFPHTDPYSFTAHGAPWVVQSWIPAVLYAAAEKVGGAAAIRLLCGVLAGVLMALVWRLTRPARTLVPRVATAGATLVVGAGLWASRPYMLGLILLATTLVIVREGRRPLWLVPIFWLWVNSHGSWPLGLVLLAVWWLGQLADHAPTRHVRRCLEWAVVGSAAGAVGPLGISALTFPVELLGRTKALAGVVEWQAPGFTTLAERAFLAAVLVALVCLVRRPTYRNGLLAAVFVGAALLGTRNIVVASLVLVPVLADGLVDLGSIESDRRSLAQSFAAAVVVVVAVVAGIGQFGRPSWDLGGYPVKATAYLQQHHLIGEGHRVIARDFVGNYWEYRFGPDANVYFDDRFDMYSDQLNIEHRALIEAKPGWAAMLDRWHPDAVLWERTSPLTQVLAASTHWRAVYHDADWVVFVPTS